MYRIALQLRHQAFPELAAGLRSRAVEIADAWMNVVREFMPQMDRLTIQELRNDIPAILEAVAKALASDDEEGLEQLRGIAEQHGFARFISEHDVADIFQEERLLRGVVVIKIEEALGRPVAEAEAASLHATIDVVLQQSVLAMIQRQQQALREAAEGEVKYLAFLSHDLNNNLAVVDAALSRLSRRLERAAGGGAMSQVEGIQAVNSLREAREAIRGTVSGMQRLLEHERLRKAGQAPTLRRVDLCALAQRIARRFEPEAERKRVPIEVRCTPPEADAALQTDEELLGLILQNLLGNAVKFSNRPDRPVAITITRAEGDEQARTKEQVAESGEGRRTAAGGTEGRRPGTRGWCIAIADQGPGITPQQRERLFQAFKRGQGLGQEGVGLGLAIVAQAARLLEAELTVDSAPGAGSTFTVVLPERALSRAGAAVPQMQPG